MEVIHVSRNPGSQYRTCSAKEEGASKQAYLNSLMAWSQGTGTSCQMPCRTTSLTLKKIYETDIEIQPDYRYFEQGSLLEFFRCLFA
jgi:hypothetical protein